VDGEWYYSREGKRYGPAADDLLRKLVVARTLVRDTPVWRAGMADWVPASQTEINSLFSLDAKPPPLMGESVNNSIVWILAFVPLLAAFVEYFLAAATESPQTKFWWIAIPMNIVLCLADSRKLKHAGHDTEGMFVWALFLVPVYLFVRASRLKQNPVYGFVWLATFFISFFI
jgi:GYF domain 2